MRIFLKTFVIIFIPLVLLLIISLNYIDKIIETNLQNETLNEMRSKWILLNAYNIENKLNVKTYRILKKISEKTRLRITVIKKNGVVVYDSFLSPEKIAKMENHKGRPEIVEAVSGKKHEGYSVRYSRTLKIRMFYYARPIDKNLILRIAYPLDYLAKFKNSYIDEIGKTFTMLIVVCLFISVIIAVSVSSPVSKLEKLSEKITEGDDNIVFPEFRDATFGRIGDVVYKIYHSMRQKQMIISHEKEKAEAIFSVLEEGIILLNEKNIILYFNNKSEEHLNRKLEAGINIFDLKNLDYGLINFLEVINRGNGSFKRSLNNKIFEIYVKSIGNEKLFIFYDISKQLEYSEFKHKLVGNISHELKTPIATIMNYAETILEFKNLNRQELEQFIEIIYKNAKRTDELIYDIIELHKLENIKSIKTSETTDINEIISEIQSRINDNKKKLIVKTNIKKINMLPQHFESLITNLIDNAFKYSEGKNVYLNIEKDKKVIIQVIDEGPLIKESERKKIFERFYTVSKSRNKNRSGSGLGLSIVKHIATLYNGAVRLYPDKRTGGNTFEVEMS